MKDLSNIFGKPREGVHSFRLPILDIAVVDLMLTIIVAFFIARHFNKSFIDIFIILMLIAILSHQYFGVKTKLNSLIFS